MTEGSPFYALWAFIAPILRDGGILLVIIGIAIFAYGFIADEGRSTSTLIKYGIGGAIAITIGTPGAINTIFGS